MAFSEIKKVLLRKAQKVGDVIFDKSATLVGNIVDKVDQTILHFQKEMGNKKIDSASSKSSKLLNDDEGRQEKNDDEVMSTEDFSLLPLPDYISNLFDSSVLKKALEIETKSLPKLKKFLSEIRIPNQAGELVPISVQLQVASLAKIRSLANLSGHPMTEDEYIKAIKNLFSEEYQAFFADRYYEGAFEQVEKNGEKLFVKPKNLYNPLAPEEVFLYLDELSMYEKLSSFVDIYMDFQSPKNWFQITYGSHKRVDSRLIEKTVEELQQETEKALSKNRLTNLIRYFEQNAKTIDSILEKFAKCRAKLIQLRLLNQEDAEARKEYFLTIQEGLNLVDQAKSKKLLYDN